MAPGFEDLQQLVPEQLRHLSEGRLRVVLLGIIVVLLVTCVTLGVMVGLHAGGVVGPGAPPSGPAAIVSSACMTTACLETAARMSENIDKSANPCSDFFQYSCGGWAVRHQVPSSLPDYTVKRKLQDANSDRLRALMEGPILHNGNSSSERKLKQFFAMCLHDYGRMRDAGAALIDAISAYLKGWYVLDPDGWKDAGWNVNDAISDVQGELNVDVLLRMSVTIHRQSRENMIMVSPGGTGMYYRYYLREDKVGVQEAYKDYMRQVAMLLIRDANVTLDASETERRVEQFVTDAYGQERHLAELLRNSRSGSRSLYRARTVELSELEANYTQLPWREMIQRAFEGFEVADDTRVYISSFGYFQMVNELLANETTDKDRIMNNYIVWQLASSFNSFMGWEYKYARYKLFQKQYGRTEFPATWTGCLRLVQQKLGSLLAAEFIRNHATLDDKNQVTSMVTYIKAAMKDSIEHIHWMDNTTKVLAEEKVDALNFTVAFPDSYFNRTFLDNLHSRVTVNKTAGFFTTLLSVEKFQRYLRTQELTAGTRYYMWRYVKSGGGAGANPIYFWRNNYLLVPFGSMQFPLYQSTDPRFMNFGGLGSLAADDMMSAMNELGRYMWTNGTFTNWWTDDTLSGYVKAKTCFTNFFQGTKVGPFLVDGENKTVVITDRVQSRKAVDVVSGIRTAYKAYQNFVKDQGEEQMPVGLDLTPEQAFFVSAAQTQCFVRRPKAAYMYARYQYLPANVLYNGALTHMKEFAEVFKCKPESPMATNETCNVF